MQQGRQRTPEDLKKGKSLEETLAGRETFLGQIVK